jgi:hypothetical protein
VVKIFGDFPFMLSLVEAFLGFFSRIDLWTLTLIALSSSVLKNSDCRLLKKISEARRASKGPESRVWCPELTPDPRL